LRVRQRPGEVAAAPPPDPQESVVARVLTWVAGGKIGHR